MGRAISRLQDASSQTSMMSQLTFSPCRAATSVPVDVVVCGTDVGRRSLGRASGAARQYFCDDARARATRWLCSLFGRRRADRTHGARAQLGRAHRGPLRKDGFRLLDSCSVEHLTLLATFLRRAMKSRKATKLRRWPSSPTLRASESPTRRVVAGSPTSRAGVYRGEPRKADSSQRHCGPRRAESIPLRARVQANHRHDPASIRRRPADRTIQAAACRDHAATSGCHRGGIRNPEPLHDASFAVGQALRRPRIGGDTRDAPCTSCPIAVAQEGGRNSQ